MGFAQAVLPAFSGSFSPFHKASILFQECPPARRTIASPQRCICESRREKALSSAQIAGFQKELRAGAVRAHCSFLTSLLEIHHDEIKPFDRFEQADG
jgi:hypothetical protein